MEINDEVLVKGKIVGFTESGNPFVEFPSGIRVMVKKDDVIDLKDWCIKIERDESDSQLKHLL